MAPRADQLAAGRVGADPVTQALIGPMREAVRAELHQHLPRLAYKTAEVARMLGGVSSATVCRMVDDGRLQRIDGPQSNITIGSILELVGWPLDPAPAIAPLVAIPSERAS